MLAGVAGQRFGSMVERGGPLGELVQWADLSASLIILGHNLTLATSQEHLRRCHFLSSCYTVTVAPNLQFLLVTLTVPAPVPAPSLT